MRPLLLLSLVFFTHAIRRAYIKVDGQLRCATSTDATFTIWLMEDDDNNDDVINKEEVELWENRGVGFSYFAIEGEADDTPFDIYVEPYLKIEHNCNDKEYDGHVFCAKLPDTRGFGDYWVTFPNNTAMTNCAKFEQ
ncbi:hypothetical protein PENTCL1PPCAC_19171 [Pristionchus entomophagus]|uniref:C-type lectin n=1 Tax=Pristionchus entomophagus TaxID=358040 RepID=A0AAV5TRP6_9BILA|nr:hypothetical protein PENTCL1PPCAC_19171 [Pristionchus entomophagus]